MGFIVTYLYTSGELSLSNVLYNHTHSRWRIAPKHDMYNISYEPFEGLQHSKFMPQVVL